jgi:hypothetical protein
MLLFEVVVTRLFSVLFYHHFSFFAISLVMSGLVIGGILASRWDAVGLSDKSFTTRLTMLSGLFSVTTLAGILALTNSAELDAASTLSLARVAVYATLFLPGLIAAGAFLALAFARNPRWIGNLYAMDLVAASLACIAAIAALRVLSGPAVIVVVAGLAAAGTVCTAPTSRARWAGFGLLAVAAGLIWSSAAGGGRFLSLKTKGEMPLVERWNEHSLVRAFAQAGLRYLVIDRGAATAMRSLPAPPTPDPSWKGGAQHAVYRLGRSFERVAIIGVGGGRDLLPPIFHGVKHVDGYEINQTMIDFLQRDFRDFNTVTTRPEVRLIHDNARNGIAHSGQQYDVIQASLIDTWAATASGGFVLSENSLYTREGWRVFLEHLTPAGILTMSRWHIPDAPAETHRLVALAAASLEDAGITDVASHIVLLQSNKSEDPVAYGGGETRSIGTILVSRSPFSAEEARRLAVDAEAAGGELIAAPGVTPANPGAAKTARPRDARGRHCRESVQHRAADRSQALFLSTGAARRSRQPPQAQLRHRDRNHLQRCARHACAVSRVTGAGHPRRCADLDQPAGYRFIRRSAAHLSVDDFLLPRHRTRLHPRADQPASTAHGRARASDARALGRVVFHAAGHRLRRRRH